MKWNDFPVILSFTEKEAKISMIPFPTVTICPETKANKDKFDLTSVYNSMKRSKINLNRTE